MKKKTAILLAATALSIHKKSCKVVLYNKKEKGFNNIQCNVVHIEIIRE